MQTGIVLSQATLAVPREAGEPSHQQSPNVWPNPVEQCIHPYESNEYHQPSKENETSFFFFYFFVTVFFQGALKRNSNTISSGVDVEKSSHRIINENIAEMSLMRFKK